MTHPIPGADLDRLEALAKAATPGDWTAKPHGRLIGGPIRHYTNGSGQAQIAAFSVTYHDQAPNDEPERQQANTDFSAALSPATALRLVAMARAAAKVGANVAIHQIRQVRVGGGVWTDVDHETYAQYKGAPYERRIVYTSPLAAGAPAETPKPVIAGEQIDQTFKRLADSILQATTNEARNEALRGIAALIDQIAAQPSHAPIAGDVEKDAALRATVLEEAALICEEQHHNWRWDDEPDSDSGPRSCARAIRAAMLANSSSGEAG